MKQPAHRSQRIWFFRLIGLVFPVICVLLAEGLMRWCGWGETTPLVLVSSRDPSGKTFYLNPQADLTYSSIDLAGPEPKPFPRHKSPDTLRVVVLGASSVQGYPHPSELSFPRHLQLILQRQLPDRQVEVLNAGIIGLATTPLVDLTAQCFVAEPDIVVLYAGHNEFYGVGGVATNARLSHWGIMLRKSRLIRSLSGGQHTELGQSGKGMDLIEELPTSYRIPNDSPLVGKAEAAYASNIRQIIHQCQRHSVPLLICTPVCNLRDQSPLVLEEDMPLQSETEPQMKKLAEQEQWEVMQSVLGLLIEEHPDCAYLQYRLAQSLEYLGQRETAAAAYEKARDLDPCRYRALSQFSEILAESVEEAGSGVWIVDLVSRFAEKAEYAAPGQDLFLEHVHLNIEGHWQVALGIGEELVTNVLQQNWAVDAVPTTAERDEFLHLRTEDRLVAANLAYFIYSSKPFSESTDSVESRKRLSQAIDLLREGLTADERTAYDKLDNGTKVRDLIDGLGRIHLEAGELELALQLFEASMERRPWMPNGFVFAAITQHLLHEDEAATDLLKRSRQTVLAETPSLMKDRQWLSRELRQSGK